MLVWKAHGARIRDVAFSPESATLATTAQKSRFVWLWHATTGEPVGSLTGHTDHARAVAFSPDGRFVAGTQHAPHIHVWSRATGAVAARLNSERFGAENLAFRPDSSALAVPALSRGVLEFSLVDSGAPGQLIVPMHRREVTADGARRVAFSPVGNFVGIAGNRNLHLHRSADWVWLHTFRSEADVSHFAFAPDDSVIAAVFGTRILVWPLFPIAGAPVELRGHTNSIQAIGFHPNGQLVSAGTEGQVRVWDVTTGGVIRTFDWGIGQICAAAVSSDGLLAAAGSVSGQVVVWDLDG